jgi:hypothetical protein
MPIERDCIDWKAHSYHQHWVKARRIAERPDLYLSETSAPGPPTTEIWRKRGPSTWWSGSRN